MSVCTSGVSSPPKSLLSVTSGCVVAGTYSLLPEAVLSVEETSPVSSLEIDLPPSVVDSVLASLTGTAVSSPSFTIGAPSSPLSGCATEVVVVAVSSPSTGTEASVVVLPSVVVTTFD